MVNLCILFTEMLDEEEFGEGSTNTFDKDTIVPAEELDLWVFYMD